MNHPRLTVLVRSRVISESDQDRPGKVLYFQNVPPKRGPTCSIDSASFEFDCKGCLLILRKNRLMQEMITPSEALKSCVSQLTDIVENINGEFDEIEAQTGDIVCVHELWSRYMKKTNMR